MSLDNAKAFLKKADADKALRQKIEALAGDGEAGAKLGADNGFTFTADEFLSAYDDAFGELSDEELENAAGGLGGIKPKIEID